MKNVIVAACHSEWRPCFSTLCRVRQRVLRHVGLVGFRLFSVSKKKKKQQTNCGQWRLASGKKCVSIGLSLS